MANKRQVNKSQRKNGEHPEIEVISEAEIEMIPPVSAKPEPQPQQADWGSAEGGEPVPLQQEFSGWAEALTTQEEDAKWDGSNEPDPAMTPAEAKEQAGWGAPDGAISDDGVWTPDSGLTAEEITQIESDTWDANAPQGLTLNIHTHSGVFNKDQFKFLLYGDTGTEKSRTASTFPNAIFADVDHGMSSVTEHVDVAWIDDNENGFKQLQELYRFLANDQHDYETVVLDTLNEMQRVIMRYTVDEYTHVRRSYGNLPGQSDYGKMLYEFMELTRSFISLPMKVVLLAQVNSQQFDTDSVGPQLIGKNTARELARKMDIIGWIHKAEAAEGTVPEIIFDSPVYTTKDRSNKLPQALQRPTYGRMAAYWK